MAFKSMFVYMCPHIHVVALTTFLTLVKKRLIFKTVSNIAVKYYNSAKSKMLKLPLKMITRFFIFLCFLLI